MALEAVNSQLVLYHDDVLRLQEEVLRLREESAEKEAYLTHLIEECHKLKNDNACLQHDLYTCKTTNEALLNHNEYLKYTLEGCIREWYTPDALFECAYDTNTQVCVQSDVYQSSGIPTIGRD